MNQADRRVIKTKQALGEALIALIKEQGFEAVTIQEITAVAHVGYRTYFRHYPDKEALLLDILQNTIEELRELLQLSPESGLAFDIAARIENGRLLFDHVQQNSDLYWVLLNSGPVALTPVMQFARDEALRYLATDNSGIPKEILANHAVSSTLSLIQWWLENEMPYSPQEMGTYYAKLIMIPVGLM